MTKTATAGSSPLKAQRQGADQPHNQFLGVQENAEKRRRKLLHDIAGMCKFRYVRKIINLLSGVKAKTPHLDCSGVPHGNGKEVFMYTPMAAAVSPCIPDMEFVDTSGKVDTTSQTKPDAILLPLGAFEDKVRVSKDPNHPDKVTYNYMPYADLIWEFKPTAAQDPFDDKVDKALANPEAPQSLESDTQEALRTRGQLTDYVTQVMSLQHRTHVFTICIVGHKARIIRWDRSGCMASEAFDYKSGENNYLGEFLWRYNHASRSERGFDDTAVEATEAEVAKFTTTVRRFLKSFGDDNKEYRQKLEASIGNADHVAYKIKVTDKATKEVSHYVVRQPFAEVLSPCGRSTRGYLAYHVEKTKAVFFKDTWRVVTEGILEEADIYATLIDAGVPNLPTVLASGDVYSLSGALQETLTHIMNSDEDLLWTTIVLRHHIHHRLVQELALPISFVRSSQQLVQVFRDILYTIMKAFETKGFLHRDISAGNVMLTQAFEGILNDWDHGVQVPQQHQTRPYRTGTWAFMSIELLNKRPKIHALVDDVESCFWLILFIASRYFEGGIHSRSNLWDEVGQTEDLKGDVIAKGGALKAAFLGDRDWELLSWPKSEPLTCLIHEFAEKMHDYQEMRKKRSRSAQHEEKYQETQNSLSYVADAIRIFDDALKRLDWPKDDAVPDKQVARRAIVNEQKDLAAKRNTFSKTTQNTTGNALVRVTLAAAASAVPGSSKGVTSGQTWAAPQARLRDPLPEYSTGDKRPGPVDDEALPGPSGQIQYKRAKKDEEAALDPQPVAQPTAPAEPPVTIPQSESPDIPRPIVPRPRRTIRSKSPNKDHQASEPAPAVPLRRSARSRSQNAARAENTTSTDPPRRVTRSTTRKASEENLRRTRSQTRARAKSANGRI